jgi:mono/diheme cytochrome c family protein
VAVLLWNVTSRGTAQTSSPKAQPETAAALFGRYCERCHGADGKGGKLEGTPNFTSAAWQNKRTDFQLRASILEGRGIDMPAFRQRLDESQAKALVAHIRTFSPKDAGKEKRDEAIMPASWDVEQALAKLQKEFDNLRQQFKELTDAKSPEPPADMAAGKTRKGTSPKAKASTAALYQQHCQRCHGPDGKGLLKGLPDFSDRAWHEKHSDVHLMVRILDGGGEMPSFREHLNGTQVRDLANHLRKFQACDCWQR